MNLAEQVESVFQESDVCIKGLSRLIQNIMAAEGLYLVEGKKPWYRWWR